MQTMTANLAKTQFGLLLDTAQREPVQITKHNRVVGVMLSAHEYEGVRAYYAQQVVSAMHEAGRYAAEQGLTEEKLAELLADES
jgi:prevent-host-death family protein